MNRRKFIANMFIGGVAISAATKGAALGSSATCLNKLKNPSGLPLYLPEPIFKFHLPSPLGGAKILSYKVNEQFFIHHISSEEASGMDTIGFSFDKNLEASLSNVQLEEAPISHGQGRRVQNLIINSGVQELSSAQNMEGESLIISISEASDWLDG